MELKWRVKRGRDADCALLQVAPSQLGTEFLDLSEIHVFLV